MTNRFGIATALSACTRFLACVVCVCVWCAIAQAQTIETGHVYVMGDSDTRAQAVRMCYAEAERKALEQAGVYMESRTSTENFMLAADEVRSFTAAVLQVQRLEDSLTLEGQHMSVHCRCRVTFNAEEVREQLKRIADNPGLKQDLKAADDAVRSARELALHPGTVPADQGGAERQGGNDAAGRDRALQDLDALKRKREAIVRSNQDLNRAGRVAVARGMSPEQVASLLGEPQATQGAVRGGYQFTCERYGSLWVVYRDKQALCLRKQLQSRPAEGLCHCAGSADTFVWR